MIIAITKKSFFFILILMAILLPYANGQRNLVRS